MRNGGLCSLMGRALPRYGRGRGFDSPWRPKNSSHGKPSEKNFFILNSNNHFDSLLT